MLRHMAAELKRKGEKTIILALHPGEVSTDMANIDVGWEVEGQLTPAESVEACIKVIETKGPEHSGTFWTWENKVRHLSCPASYNALSISANDRAAISVVTQMTYISCTCPVSLIFRMWLPGWSYEQLHDVSAFKHGELISLLETELWIQQLPFWCCFEVDWKCVSIGRPETLIEKGASYASSLMVRMDA